MRIGLVQINPVIGDFSGNCRRILTWARKAADKDCRLVIFPELAVSGYPPQDLLERGSFLRDHEKSVADLCRQLPDITVIFGAIEQRLETGGKSLYNSLLVVCRGEIVSRIRKQLLPTYDVFDESRYFEPGGKADLYEIEGLTLGLTVCEDIWHHSVGQYDVDPVADLFGTARASGRKIDCLVNISASPFQLGKHYTRSNLFRTVCEEYSTPLLFVNQVGGQDSLLFDGHSLVMDNDGNIAASCCGFDEDLIVVDTDSWQGDMHDSGQDDEVALVYRALVMGVRDYVSKCGFSSVVLGLSGGIDSALTAVIAADALGPENVLGVALPSPYSSNHSLEDARGLAENIGCGFEVLPIKDLFAGFKTALSPLFTGLNEDVTEQNLQARIRGNLLMALSNKFGHLLLSTGNKSEMAVGYCTLYGDMNGGLAVISDVPKQLVYELSCYVNRGGERIPERTISKPPSAELKPDQCDQDDLPDYHTLDRILEMHLEQGLGLQEIVAEGFAEPVVADILRRIRINEYKRKQAPMGLKVTSKAFGYGRRYPNVQNYQK